jgi:DNA gyrase/topoisomerase IV subunit B
MRKLIYMVLIKTHQVAKIILAKVIQSSNRQGMWLEKLEKCKKKMCLELSGLPGENLQIVK